MTETASKTEQGLNLKQEDFCQLYISVDREMFGNGVQCYIEAYDPDTTRPNWYKSAMASSSRLLTNVKIIARINGLLEKGGFTDENVTKQHLFLLNQHTDLKTKMKAISDYYKLRGKYEPDKMSGELNFKWDTDEPNNKNSVQTEGMGQGVPSSSSKVDSAGSTQESGENNSSAEPPTERCSENPKQ